MEGVEVACILESPLELFARVSEHTPDVVLIDTESPSRDVLEQLAVMSSSAPRAVVLFTGDAESDTIRAALRAGVSAYIVDGIAPARLDPIMRVAMERFEADQKLRAELDDTRARLEERKLVERAKGILMKQRGSRKTRRSRRCAATRWSAACAWATPRSRSSTSPPFSADAPTRRMAAPLLCGAARQPEARIIEKSMI
jgi:response regulator NasT